MKGNSINSSQSGIWVDVDKNHSLDSDTVQDISQTDDKIYLK